MSSGREVDRVVIGPGDARERSILEADDDP
jgi:hypothetical protein